MASPDTETVRIASSRLAAEIALKAPNSFACAMRPAATSSGTAIRPSGRGAPRSCFPSWGALRTIA